jgi:hypothetical protein
VVELSAAEESNASDNILFKTILKEERRPVMRVRPFFWCVLALTCIGVLLFAATQRTHAPVRMQVHLIQQSPIAAGLTTIEMRLTDTQGLPIEQAQVMPSAQMTNMDMTTHNIRVESLGGGNYMAHLSLYMAGPWEIRIVAKASGFDPLQQVLLVEVQ